MVVKLRDETTSRIEHLLKTASLMVNATNQVIIHFDKPEDMTVEDVASYLSNLGCLPTINNSGCGDPA